jgi:4-amino-4-deoxy-L-arabinose transferase-like glycosyltransferase
VSAKTPQARHLVLLGLLMAIQFTSGVAAIRADQVVMVPDGADYFDWSNQIARPLRQGALGQAFSALWGNPERGPLGIVPAALIQAVGGASVELARISSLFWLLALMGLTYRIARRLHSVDAGLLAAAAVSTVPLISGFSRLLWLDLPLTAATALAIWMLLRTGHFSCRRASLAFGAAVGLGLLIKPSLPIYLLFPALGSLVLALRRPGQRARALLNALLAGLLALGLFALWAGAHLHKVLGTFRQARPAEPGDFFPIARATADASRLTHYLREIPLNYLGPALSVLFLVAMVIAVRRERRALLWISMLWLWGAILLLNIFVPWGRYVMPALPALAVVIGVGLPLLSGYEQRRRWLTPLLCALLVLFSIQQTWFGPELSYCRAYQVGKPETRVLCSGMLRAVATGIKQPNLKGLPLPPRGHVLMLVVPATLEPTPPHPFTSAQEAFRQWLVLETDRQIEMLPLARNQREELVLLNRLHLLIISQPRPPWRVPIDQQRLHKRVMGLVARHADRWRRVRTVRFEGIGDYMIYQNTRPPPG